MMPMLSNTWRTSASKLSGTFWVFRSLPICPETYRVPSTKIAGLNGPPGANSLGWMIFFSASADVVAPIKGGASTHASFIGIVNHTFAEQPKQGERAVLTGFAAVRWATLSEQ